MWVSGCRLDAVFFSTPERYAFCAPVRDLGFGVKDAQSEV